MSTLKKLEQAQFFQDQMEMSRNNPTEFGYYLSAFSSATQDFIHDISTKVQDTPYHIWYENSLDNSPVFRFFADTGNLNYHYQIATKKEPLAVTHEDTKPSGVPHSSSFLGTMYWQIKQLFTVDEASSQDIPHPDLEREINRYYFDTWTEHEEVMDICTKYLMEIANLFKEGQKLGYLT